MKRDVEAVRILLANGNDVRIDARDPVNGQTALMVAAAVGDLECAWLLVDAKADLSCRDKGGQTALDIARSRNCTDIISLLGGIETPRAGPPQIPDFSSEDEEPPAPKVAGHVLVFDHVVTVTQVDLRHFAWERYEAGLAKLAGVSTADVFVTPEPGRSQHLELHATVIKTLEAAEASSNAGIDEVMTTVKRLQKRTPLQTAAGIGAASLTILTNATVKIFGEVHTSREAVAQHVQSLRQQRDAYDEQREAFEAATGDAAARGLCAGKAILLLRPARQAVETAQAQGAASQAHQRKRHGGK